MCRIYQKPSTAEALRRTVSLRLTSTLSHLKTKIFLEFPAWLVIVSIDRNISNYLTNLYLSNQENCQ